MQEYYTISLCLVERFHHSNLRYPSKIDKNCIKTLKIGIFWKFSHFLGHFWSPWGQPEKFKILHKYISHEAKFIWDHVIFFPPRYTLLGISPQNENGFFTSILIIE